MFDSVNPISSFDNLGDSIGKSITKTLGANAADKILSAVLALIVCVIAIKLISKLTKKLLGKSRKLDGTIKGFIASAVKILLWILTAIIVADSLGIPTTSLVALVSVAGLALSLSVQNIMSNLFSGITLLVSKPFVAGNFVDIGGKLGTIKTVGLFYTVMDTLDNTVVSIPNADVTSASLVNYSAEPLRRVDLNFCASYKAATEDVRKAIFDAIGKDSRILTDPAPFVALSKYNDSNIEYVVRVWCNNADYWDVYFALNENVRESFAANGVEMTYQHVNVHVVEK